MKTKKLNDSDTGETLFALVPVEKKERDEFCKVFVVALEEICKDHHFANLPIGLLSWVLFNATQIGTLDTSSAEYGRARNLTNTTVIKHFRMLVKYGLIAQNGMAGNIKRYLVNPNIISKNSVAARKKAAKQFDSVQTVQTIVGSKKTPLRSNKKD